MLEDLLITIKDNNTEIPISQGSTFTIKLEENPTTGYRWSFKNLEKSPFELVSDNFQLNPDSQDGGGGTHFFNIKIEALGKYDLQLFYSRGWESPALEIFKVTINSK